jgi:hypothetical protein
MTRLSAKLLKGSWRILKMQLWDRDYLDLEVPAHLTFEGDRLGSFQFGAVRGWIDYRVVERDGRPAAEFSWEGFNDSDPSSGRGWAVVNGNEMQGRLFLHNGDDSAFTAQKSPSTRGR